MRPRFALTVAALLALALPAQAQIDVGIGAGASVPTGSFDDWADVGFHVTGLITTRRAPSPLGFRAELSVTRFDVAGGGDDARMVDGTANLFLTPRGYMPTKPYFIVGVGAYNVDQPGLSIGNSRINRSSSTRLGVNAGFGLDIGRGLRRMFLEARWVSVNPGEGNRITFVPVSFGVTF